MNKFRKQHLINKEKEIVELYNKIKDKQNPEILDLWLLDENRFIEWRKRNDFPKLLKHFDKTLFLFKEWKSDNKLTNELIIENGEITPFLERKKLSKNKNLFICKQTCNGEVRKIVSYTKLEGEKKYLGQTFYFEPVSKFQSYLDWLHDRQKSVNVLYINSRTSPNTDMERVSIHSDVYSSSRDFELLKMGGIEIPVNSYNILMRGKKLEFVNLCGLRLSGSIYYGEEGNLSCSYSACDNMTAENLEMASLEFTHCSVKNFNLVNSKIQQWQFYDCFVTGDFINSQLRNIDIYGGRFDPVMSGCNLSDVEIINDKVIENHNLSAYQLLKKTYVEQGDDNNAIRYFIKEQEFIRKRSGGLKYIFKSISAFYWGYGRKPGRIIWNSLGMIILFSFFYYFNREDILLNNGKPDILNIWDCLYFSSTTFTTLGYGDYSPIGLVRIGATIESLLGVLNIGFLVAGFASNKY